MLANRLRKRIQNVLIGSAALMFVGVRFVPGANSTGPVMAAASELVTGVKTDSAAGTIAAPASPLSAQIKAAVATLKAVIKPLSNASALNDAFGSYFAYKAAHPTAVKKPYLYFVDYGLPSTTPRGYVFDMNSLTVVDGPFTVAHGRGSSVSQYGVPTRFSNASGSATTSLGLYLTGNTYDFHGKSGGQPYSSIGLKLNGVSDGFNDKAFARGVVAHGAPYVTPAKAGRSEGCPAMEQTRAATLLPKLSNGSMVFLFAPDANWMSSDPWIAAGDL